MAEAAHYAGSVLPVRFNLSEGQDLTQKMVLQRRKQLEEIITPIDGIDVGGYIANRGKDLFRQANE
jgi:ATP-dependent DNA ligase